VKIAICESNSHDAVRLNRLLERFKNERQLEMDVTVYKNSQELLKGFSPVNIHVILLDAAFDGMDGIEIAKRLQAVNPNCAVIFTAASPAYAAQSYSVLAAHYLVKPISYETLTTALSRCDSQIRQFSKYIEVTANRETQRILHRDIRFIEVFGKNCLIHTGWQCNNHIPHHRRLGKISGYREFYTKPPQLHRQHEPG
jgi:DNA-binding LytR/AlgR family response regulator